MVRILTAMCVIAFASAVHAAPLKYTFSGSVVNLNDAGGLIGSSLNNGTPSEYSFVIDTDQPGSSTFGNGTTLVFSDDAANDLFFADFVSGGLITGGVQGGSGNIAEYNYGQTFIAIGITQILGRGEFDRVLIRGNQPPVDWQVGDVFSGEETAVNGTGQSSRVFTALTLTSVNAVPVPAAAWLFGSALLGLGFIKRRTA